MEFDWDIRKAAVNVRKHGIRFEEAITAFGDPFAVTFQDPDHSFGEHRFLLFGVSQTGLLLVISFVDRGKRTRIISARRAARSERRIYEEG